MHLLTVKQTTVGGSVSAASVALAVTIDTVAPTKPGTPDLSTASDTGRSSTDNTTKVATPIFTGKAEAGSAITLFDGATAIGSGRVDEFGVWSITSALLADGTHSINTKATDAAGNVSVVSSSLTMRVDTTAPTASTTPDMSDASDSGIANTDNITNVTTPTFTGTAEASSTITLYDGTTVIGTVSANSLGAWSIKSGLLRDGLHAIQATVTDAAGNTSVASTALNVRIDTSLPAAPAAFDMTTASDSGSSSTDNITKITTPTFTGTAEAGATVRLVEGATVYGSAVASGSGAWSITSATLSEGAHSLRTRATDVAGNASILTEAILVRIDTVAGPAPAITSVTSTTVGGTATATSTVTLFDGATKIGTATATGQGDWSIKTALAGGNHTITATETDVAGNTGPASAAKSVAMGTTGNNDLPGTVGADLMFGLARDDTYHVNHAGDVVTEKAGEGSDTILATLGYTIGAGQQIEFLRADAGATGLALTGNELANTIVGGTGNDTLTGGGAGDVLTGGGGSNIYVLTALTDSGMTTTPRDTITDFSVLLDTIDLHLLDANTTLAGDQAFTFIGNAAFSNVAGQLNFGALGADTRVMGDVNGDGTGDFSILLTGSKVLTGSNFVL